MGVGMRAGCRASVAVVLTLVGMTERRALSAEDQLPKSTDPRVKIEVFAESPQIATPTGVDVDRRGRVWAIESNTHFPPEGYKGHASDRVLVMRDTDGDGRADEIVTFLDGLKHAMSIALRPNDDVYVATRKEILLCRDADNDGKAESTQRVIQLDTPADYPHNGLAGFAFDALGWMYFGLGENLGADYRVVGTDGMVETGGGEGGSVYRCRLDGTQLSRWATGFWNPHASCFDAFGRLFSVDNDPDSRPPCRLLHIVPDGDYGYRFRNGRKGLHPFTAWNGEIAGTLPMVAGTGEAPSGILAYESDGLPAEYRGDLFVTSWGDHRIDRFRLKPKGTSFTSTFEPLITGGENFRPVGIALAPDGSLYCTDWVLKEYKVHGQGRVWRISPAQASDRVVLDVAKIETVPRERRKEYLSSPRLDVRRAEANALARLAKVGRHLAMEVARDAGREYDTRGRIEALWAFLAAAGEHEVRLRLSQDQGKDVCERRDEVATAVEWFAALKNRQVLDAPRPTLPVPVSLASLLDPKATKPHDPQLLLAAIAADRLTESNLDTLLPSSDPFVFGMTIAALAAELRRDSALFASLVLQKFRAKETSPRVRLGLFLATRRFDPKRQELLEAALKGTDPELVRAAVQWIAEERLHEFKPQLEAVLEGRAISNDLFLATLAGLELLEGVKPAGIDQTPASQYVVAIVRDERRSPALRAQALRILAPDDKALNAKLLEKLLASSDPALRRETVRTLQGATLPEAAEMLRAIAADEKEDDSLRAEAIVGLARAAETSGEGTPVRKLLDELILSDNPVLRIEALRSSRGLARDAAPSAALARLAETFKDVSGSRTAQEQELVDQIRAAYEGAKEGAPAYLAGSARPSRTEEWVERLREGGDADAGRRIFHHSKSAGCYKCHMIEGRGGRIGPDLSLVARTMDRKKLVESIIEPSKEVSPQFVTWSLVMKSGQVHTGLLLGERDDRIELGTSEGKVLELPADEIESRTPQKTSVMPDKLAGQLTVEEFRNLIAFLETLK